MTLTIGTPTKQNPCKAKIEFLPEITPPNSMWYCNEKQNTTHPKEAQPSEATFLAYKYYTFSLNSISMQEAT